MQCLGCKKDRVDERLIGEKCFACDFCKRGVCEKCAMQSFTSSEIRVLQLKKDRKLKYACSVCVSKCTRDISIEDIVKSAIKEEVLKLRKENEEVMKKNMNEYEIRLQKLTDTNDLLREAVEQIRGLNYEGSAKLEKEIQELQNTVKEAKVVKDIQEKGNVKSYSQAAKQGVILVRPKDGKQTSSATKQEVETKVDPGEMGLGVSKIKYVNKGGVAIKCNKEGKTMENICLDLEDKLGHDYEIKKLDKRNPKIKIFNVYKADAERDGELIDKILKQNSITSVKDIKVNHKYNAKDDRFCNVILELDADTLSLLNDKETLNIGWKICKFIDYINVIQCFRCGRFGHVAKYCRNEREVCLKCSGPHGSKDCTNPDLKMCVNCRHASETLKIPKIDFNHYAMDKNCAVYKRTFQEIQQKIDYPELYMFRK